MVTFLLGVEVYQYMAMDDFTETEAQNSYRVYHPFTLIEYLQRGWDRKMKPLPTPTIYAIFSDHYCNQQLTQAAIRELYCKEVNDVLKPGSYMGI